MKPDYDNLLSYFPFDAFRGNQEQILLQLKEWLQDPTVKVIIAQAATGIGKSALALTMARAAKSAYIATANKALQDQYVRDFDHHLVNMKGRANYLCRVHPPVNGQKPFTCGNAPCRDTKESRGKCFGDWGCEYHEQLTKASKAGVTSFNFASALPYLNYLTQFFEHRNLLVCDEAHSVWQWLTDFIGISLNAKTLMELDILSFIPDYREIDKYVGLIDEVQKAVKFQLGLAEDAEEAPALGSRVEALQTLDNKLKLFDVITKDKTELDNFVIDKTFDYKNPHLVKNVAFKPVVVSDLLHDYFFKHADKTVLLSAVILDFDTYIDVMGIDKSTVKILNLDSPFPVRNRPIHTGHAVGRLSKKTLPGLLPALCDKVVQLLAHHKSVKGIVHGVSWDLCRKVYDGVDDATRGRLLLAARPEEQKEILAFHHETDRPTVLLSPSMTEGVDLKDDLSRMQVILKVPYPYLGDPVTVRRMELYENFYSMKTAQTLVQMYGRSVRSETDHCQTYVLDGNFKTFVHYNGKLLPKSFHDAIDIQ